MSQATNTQSLLPPRILQMPADMLAAATPERAALATFGLLMGLVLAAILWLCGGHVIYSLDDPYIHVALADRLRLGHYGINMGEVTSPSSSVIWPFLLLPAAGTPFNVHLPLLLNILLGGATAWLLGRFASGLPMPVEVAAPRMARIGLACLLVVASNIVGLAYTGLEHNLQVLIAAAVAVMLIEHWRGAVLPTWVMVIAALGPSVRYEMLAITAGVALILLIEGRWREMLLVSAGSLVLPALLSAFLVANGAYPLPNSVMTKLFPASVVINSAGVASVGADALARPSTWSMLVQGAKRYWEVSFGGKTMLIGAIAILYWSWRIATGTQRTVLAGALAAGVLHLMVGQFGWFYRYEIYAVVFCGMIALAALAERMPRAVPYAVALAALAHLTPLRMTPEGARNIYEQQYQMHRFVAEHWNKPFAVNDLGWVSIDLDPSIYVLDLWGLASNEAVRRPDKSPEWLDDVTRRHGTGLAIVFDTWFRSAPPAWHKVGELHLAGPRVTTAAEKVSFYATGVGDRHEIKRKLEAFRTTLPPGVKLTLE